MRKNFYQVIGVSFFLLTVLRLSFSFDSLLHQFKGTQYGGFGSGAANDPLVWFNYANIISLIVLVLIGGLLFTTGRKGLRLPKLVEVFVILSSIFLILESLSAGLCLMAALFTQGEPLCGVGWVLIAQFSFFIYPVTLLAILVSRREKSVYLGATLFLVLVIAFLFLAKIVFFPSKNLNDCNKINDDYRQSRCLDDFVQFTEDYSLCDMMRNDYFYNKCISNKNYPPTDPTVCLNFRGEESDYYKDQCYSSLAFNLKDKEVCKKIISDDERRECEREIDHLNSSFDFTR